MSLPYPEGDVAYSTDGEQRSLTKIVDLLNAGAGGGGGQILEYTGTDPTSDGLVPTNQNQPAIAYKDDGTLPTYTWNTTTHAWV